MTKKFFFLISLLVLIFGDIFAQQIDSETHETVKIGLLIDSNKNVGAINAAELAIAKANENIGSERLHFQLVVRSMEGPWGTGAKEAVKMVFDDEVWAIIGSHDGRSAHLVEQVITKTHIVFLSVWASDPTLSQAFIPWYFSCVPNDVQQAEALIEEIYIKRKIKNLSIVSDNSYDSKSSQKAFVKIINNKGLDEPKKLFYDESTGIKSLIDEIKNSGASSIILLTKPSTSMELIEQLKINKLAYRLYGFLSLLGENEFKEGGLTAYNGVILSTSGSWSGSELSLFHKEFKRKFSKIPGLVEAYAYDGMNIIINAIKNSQFDREKIREIMSKSYHKGVTGLIEFDQNGNRMNAVKLIEIKNGIPVNVE